MRRSLSVLAIAAGVLLLAWAFVQQYRPRPAAPAHPIARAYRSLLIITADTTRADHLQPYGATDVETPALDRLAHEGVVFEHAYAVAPITLPAHTAIMTGLYPPQTGVRNNGIHHVPGEITTLAERLRQRGLRTAAFVSASVLEHRYGLDHGFDAYDDDLSTGRERHPRIVPDRPAEATVNAARQWLDGLGEREPFFVWVHFYDPHAVYSPPPPFRDRYRARLYDGEIAYMDSQIGRLLEHPRLAGNNELVTVVLADHGESLGEHGEQTHGILAHDATLHIPLIVRLAGAAAGTRISTPVSQVDVVPTVLDLLGVPAAAGLAGRSAVPLLEGAAAGEPRDLYSETYLPFYTYGWAKLRVFRRGGWKFIDAPQAELFDTRRDPHELANLAVQEPGIAHDLQRDLGEFLQQSGAGEREAALQLDAASAERLRALGYLAVGSGAGQAREQRPDPKDMIDVHATLERTRALVVDRMFPEAESELRRVIGRDPSNLSALMDLANLLVAMRRVDEAVEVATRALAVDPNYARLHSLIATLEVHRDHLAAALESSERAVRLDPKDIELRVQQAQILHRLGREVEMEALMRAALKDGADDPQVNAAASQLLDLPAGDLVAAEARLRHALERDPFFELGWLLLGDTLERGGRMDEAATAYAEGLKRTPDDADLHGHLGIVLARRGGQDAETNLREAIRLAPTFQPDVHVSLGAWLAEHDRLDEAQQEYERVLAVNPGDAGARNNRAIALYRSGRGDEAEADLRALLLEHPDNADAQNNMAAIALNRSDWAAAERFARTATGLDPKLSEGWSNLGIALDGQERYADAEAAFGRALEVEPSYWQARNNLATTLRKEGRAPEAAALFEEVLRQVPRESGVHLELGDLYFGPLADPTRARAHYNAVLRANPGHPRAEELRQRLAALPERGEP